MATIKHNIMEECIEHDCTTRFHAPLAVCSQEGYVLPEYCTLKFLKEGLEHD